MDKRYQIFVSSTLTDLKDERDQVFRALMKLDCIPAGMELFTALDEEQLIFIKKLIDDCDYYILLIGGRYGSVTSDGVSYTEAEYDYAVSKGMKVIALIHGSPDEITVAKSEIDPESRVKLAAFRDKVKTGRLVSFWQNASEIPALVVLSMVNTMKVYPAVGWIRASQAPSQEILSDINNLRKQKEQSDRTIEFLKRELNAAREPDLENIADLDSDYPIRIRFLATDRWNGLEDHTEEVAATWREIFSYVAPYLAASPRESTVSTKLGEALFAKSGFPGALQYIDEQQFKTIAIQLTAYRLVSITNDNGLRWHLTDKGHQVMMESRIVRKDDFGAEEDA